MPSMPSRRIKTLSSIVLVPVLALAGLCLSACALFSSIGGTDPAPSVSPEWRLVPEATVVGQKRQFFLYGRRLDSAQVTVPPSILMEKGVLKPDGRVLSLYLTVSAVRPDSLGKGETLGARQVLVKTPDTTADFTLKIVDEAQPR
jgi:hypothetical protein